MTIIPKELFWKSIIEIMKDHIKSNYEGKYIDRNRDLLSGFNYIMQFRFIMNEIAIEKAKPESERDYQRIAELEERAVGFYEIYTYLTVEEKVMTGKYDELDYDEIMETDVQELIERFMNMSKEEMIAYLDGNEYGKSKIETEIFDSIYTARFPRYDTIEFAKEKQAQEKVNSSLQTEDNKDNRIIMPDEAGFEFRMALNELLLEKAKPESERDYQKIAELEEKAANKRTAYILNPKRLLVDTVGGISPFDATKPTVKEVIDKFMNMPKEEMDAYIKGEKELNIIESMIFGIIYKQRFPRYDTIEFAKEKQTNKELEEMLKNQDIEEYSEIKQAL